MDFKKAKVITSESVEQTVKMSGQCDCAYEEGTEKSNHGLCAAGDCACEANTDCACEVYSDCACATV